MSRYVILFLLLFVCQCGRAFAQCTSPLPSSGVSIYGLHPGKIDMVWVPDSELQQFSHSGDKPVVEVVTSLASAFSIEDEEIIRQSVGFCDVPRLVRFGLGIDKQTIYLSADSAANPCFRAALEARGLELAAEANLALEAFIDEETEFIQRSMSLLKHATAPTDVEAKAYWRVGLLQVQKSLGIDFDAEVGRLRGATASNVMLREGAAKCAAPAKHALLENAPMRLTLQSERPEE